MPVHFLRSCFVARSDACDPLVFLVKMLKGLREFVRDIGGWIHDPRSCPVFYHDIDNFGDQLTPYLVNKILKKNARLVRSPAFARVLGAGSILHFSSRNSYIWGSGLIDKDRLDPLSINKKRILALRGALSKTIIESNLGRVNCLLGDPGVLMPTFYSPSMRKNARVGIVPHYVDLECVQRFLYGTASSGTLLIDVRDCIERVADQICSCDYVISSSLHGLIFSDAYGVPNVWAAFSDKILGGEFKFLDYYSTTHGRNPFRYRIETPRDLAQMVNNVDVYAGLSHFIYDKSCLVRSLQELVLK